ncbi:hypothetical protein OE88DRAFT_1646704 [Heliocybe sulcata]|uniref:F-box domain-containing protein n=1 Tax=Heliocybe sulcata TaxID=5364 RepID=A0A5C3MW78_9AGAM|nr:hypothetical protein OE88DRAFT_1646704 [Heliocybe sulcata]
MPTDVSCHEPHPTSLREPQDVAYIYQQLLERGGTPFLSSSGWRDAVFDFSWTGSRQVLNITPLDLRALKTLTLRLIDISIDELNDLAFLGDVPPLDRFTLSIIPRLRRGGSLRLHGQLQHLTILQLKTSLSFSSCVDALNGCTKLRELMLYLDPDRTTAEDTFNIRTVLHLPQLTNLQLAAPYVGHILDRLRLPGLYDLFVSGKDQDSSTSDQESQFFPLASFVARSGCSLRNLSLYCLFHVEGQLLEALRLCDRLETLFVSHAQLHLSPEFFDALALAPASSQGLCRNLQQLEISDFTIDSPTALTRMLESRRGHAMTRLKWLYLSQCVRGQLPWIWTLDDTGQAMVLPLEALVGKSSNMRRPRFRYPIFPIVHNLPDELDDFEASEESETIDEGELSGADWL